MKRLRGILTWILIAVFCLFILAQFRRPAKTNPPVDQSLTIDAKTQMTPQVAAILDRSCRDCHSNKTHWPWYSHVAPISWLVVDDVDKGRADLNLSEWGRYDQTDAESRLRGICREVKAGVMPLGAYTLIHRHAKLSQEDVKVLCDWTNAERARAASSK